MRRLPDPYPANTKQRRSLTILLLPWVVAGGGFIAKGMLTWWLAPVVFRFIIPFSP